MNGISTLENGSAKIGFTSQQKFDYIKRSGTMINNLVAADFMTLNSFGPYFIRPGDSVEVALALVAGHDLNSLKYSASRAWGRYLGSTDVNVTGTVSDKHTVSSLKINGVNATINGSNFNAALTLAEGDQVISAVAVDSLGQTGIVERMVYVDLDGPQVDIQEPKDRQSVYTLTPFVSFQYSDYKRAVNTASLQATLQAAGGLPIDIKPLLAVTPSGASGTLTTLTADQTYTLTVTIADSGGKVGTAQSSF